MVYRRAATQLHQPHASTPGCGLFTGPAIERLKQEPDLAEIVITDTVPLPSEKQLPNIVTRSVAPLFAEAVHRIHAGESISSLFSDDETYG